MSIIKEMSETMANKIAAGEVIEKCASIVKELVENSIDANAQNIKVNLLKGGLESICVIDDGRGMDKEDAKLSFKRHATSKIYKDDDLYFINTLGFRGEALPSIASVSEVELVSCNKDIGSRIVYKGGHLIDDALSNGRIGTKITVTNLFYNTPARLKYMKSENTELANTLAYIEKLALAKPEISFTVTNNTKTLFSTSGSNDLLKSIHEIFGASVSSKMIYVEDQNEDFEIYGYISKPELLKANRNYIITFVNGRVVRNMEINKAINDAYYTYKPDTKYPFIVLNITVDPSLIDVNIHPTKQDVKISKANELYELIYNTLKNCLYKTLLIPDAIDLSASVKNDEFIDVGDLILNENVIQSEMDLATCEVIDKNKLLKSLVLYPVGLCLGTYIVAENDEGIYLIDQHAAQERVNYENYLEELKKDKKVVIPLLIPIIIELSSSDYLKINNKIDVLEQMGFVLEEYGINTLAVKAHPFFIKNEIEEESVRKIFDLVISLEKFDDIKFRENVAITLACKMAIKANEHISILQMEELLKNLVKCDNPYNCPHGRPTIIKFSNYDLEKMFKRVM